MNSGRLELERAPSADPSDLLEPRASSRVKRHHGFRMCLKCAAEVRGSRCVFCDPMELPIIGGLP